MRALTTQRTAPAGDPDPDVPFNMGVHGGPGHALGAARRGRLCEAAGWAPDRLTLAEQVHGAGISLVVSGRAGDPATGASPGTDPTGRAAVTELPCVAEGAGRAQRTTAARGCDGLVTDRRGVPLMSLSADCCPVVIVEPRRGVLAVLHAGRKGTFAGIAGAAVAVMVGRFGCRPADLHAALGPSIGGCCYQVGPEIPAEVPDRLRWFRQGDGPTGAGWYLDLHASNREQLTAAGIDPARIEGHPPCTYCRVDRFFSYRREGTGCGLLGTVAALE